jgi:hypothetical protein
MDEKSTSCQSLANSQLNLALVNFHRQVAMTKCILLARNCERKPMQGSRPIYAQKSAVIILLSSANYLSCGEQSAQCNGCIHLDQLVVAFHDGMTDKQIDAINDELGSSVLRHPSPGLRLEYKIQLPAAISLKRAWNYYTSRSEVDFVMFSVDMPIGSAARTNATAEDSKCLMSWAQFQE